MHLEHTVSEQALLSETLERETKALKTRERLAEAVVIAGFLAAMATLLAARPPHTFGLLAPAICVVVLAVATHVRFHVPSGFTVPTQLAFVPLVFAVPVAVAPLAVVLSFTLASLPDVLARRTRPGRLVHSIGNSWFAVGPAAVFAGFGTDPSRAGPAMLVLALIAQFVLDFGASSVRELIGSGSRLRDQLRETWVYGVDAALSPVALAVGYQVGDRPLMACAILPLLGVLAIFARERRARLESLIELKNAYHGTALVLGDVVEADDGYTGQHVKGVVVLALEVGDDLALGPDRRRNLEFGALLHDVGKIAIPKEIINKPGKLDPREWAIIKTHTVEGQRMLERVGGFMRQVGLIVRSHHERWDGGGYPDGLAGEAIPLESRIIACCDAWNAMRTNRSYRKAMTHQAAVNELTASAGKQFDPRIVDALLAVLERDESRRAAALNQQTAAASRTPREDTAGADVAARAASG
jgi:HD-GYP domain-containing protein (c-di-GMP phosphodiesterase class II)